MTPKPWFQSKTLWTNLGALVAAFGLYMEAGDLSALFPAALAVINVVLRLVTRQPLSG